MQVFNAASKAVLVRSFAAGVTTPQLECVLISPKTEVEVCGPIISGYGLVTPYRMIGKVLIRDWARPVVCWIERGKSAEVVLREGTYGTHIQPFALAPGLYEGFDVAFVDDCELILHKKR